MEPSRTYRPRISRETRLLLTTTLIAMMTLWVLARIRFPERPATSNPVPPLLTQLAVRPGLDSLASEIAKVKARLEPSLLPVHPSTLGLVPMPGVRSHPVAGLRIGDGLVIALISPDPVRESIAHAVVHDAASGLSAIRMPTAGAEPPPATWSPRRLEEPRYLIASDVSLQSVSLRPVFVGALDAVESPLWAAPIWLVPAHTDLTPGEFVFNGIGELVGLAVLHDGEVAVVPGENLLAEVDRLLTRTGDPAGDLGIRVQSLTSSLAAATGAIAGVVVVSVDERGAAAGVLRTGDVIETVDGRAVETPQSWNARAAQLAAGEPLPLRVRRSGTTQDVQIVAPARQAQTDNPSLGLTLRRLSGRGALVLRVEQSSIADRAGLAAGDVITFIAGISAPTPAQIRAAVAPEGNGPPILVGRLRGETPDVIVLAR